MSYGNEEASTHRRDHRAGVPPALLQAERSDHDDHEPPTHLAPRTTAAPAGLNRTPYTQRSAHQVRDVTERSAHQLQPSIHSVVRPAPHAPRPRARGSSNSVASSTRVVDPAPAAPPPAELPGMIDPLQLAVPPELAPSIFSWVRRLALQADLTTADRVLRDALAELTSSLSVAIIYPGQDGLWSLGADDEIPREAQAIVAVAQARRAVVASHTALVPVVTSSETVAVLLLTRNPRNPGYHPIEQLAMIGLARESAAVLHHLVLSYLQHQQELSADKGSLYRGEALEAHRTRGNEGSLVHLSPGWVRRTYPFLVVTLLAAAAFSVFITVPTYSSGQAVVVIDGVQVTAAQGGTVDAVLVSPGQAVNAGTPIVRLTAQAELDELTAARTEFDGATQQYLFDQTDEQVKRSLAASFNRFTLASSKVNAKTVRAPRPGTVADIRVRTGQPLQPGEPIATVVEPGAWPEVTAFLPSSDRPRLRTGQQLQVALAGFTRSRERATITGVGTEAFGNSEAAKVLGPTLADALKLPGGSYVVVKARLPRRTFVTEHHTLHFHHGMLAKAEIQISSKPFLVTLLPALEKYLPE